MNMKMKIDINEMNELDEYNENKNNVGQGHRILDLSTLLVSPNWFCY